MPNTVLIRGIMITAHIFRFSKQVLVWYFAEPPLTSRPWPNFYQFWKEEQLPIILYYMASFISTKYPIYLGRQDKLLVGEIWLKSLVAAARIKGCQYETCQISENQSALLLSCWVDTLDISNYRRTLIWKYYILLKILYTDIIYFGKILYP